MYAVGQSAPNRMAELDRLIARGQPEPTGVRRLHVRPQPIESASVDRIEVRAPDAVSGSSMIGILQLLWSVRPCFLCRDTGNCGHREPEVDLAELEAAGRAMRGGR